jgi:hypothetical protein
MMYNMMYNKLVLQGCEKKEICYKVKKRDYVATVHHEAKKRETNRHCGQRHDHSQTNMITHSAMSVD